MILGSLQCSVASCSYIIQICKKLCWMAICHKTLGKLAEKENKVVVHKDSTLLFQVVDMNSPSGDIYEQYLQPVA